MKEQKLISSLNETITDRLNMLAEVHGDANLLYYGEDNIKFNYNEFNSKTNSIGNSLNSLEVKKGDIVPVFLQNSMISMFSMFSLWKIGAVYSPINYEYQGKLLSYQLSDSNAKVIITERKLVPVINEIIDETQIEVVIVYDPLKGDHDYNNNLIHEKIKGANEISFNEMKQSKTTPITIDISSSDIANIIYTSGTTGPPKGVVQTHGWLNQYTFYRRNFFDSTDVMYNDLPLYHVGGAFHNVTSAVWAGASIALWDKFSGKKFWNRIKNSGATSIALLDVMVPYLMNADEKSDDYRNTITKVYMQPLPQNHNEVAKRFGFDLIITGYAQTEAGQGIIGIIDELKEGEGTPHNLLTGKKPLEIIKLCKELNVPVIKGNEKLSSGFMGKPSRLAEVAILNENDEKCLPGEIGELAFRPNYPNVMFSEYYNKPEETVKAFKNFWFHTGDAAYNDNNDIYFFVDRIGGVIRVKGEFISSHQIEDYLNEHKYIEISAVFPVPAEVGNEDDIAVFITEKEEGVINEEEVNEWIKKRMPKYMWPKYIHIVKDLPKTPSNKIEKYKLKKLIDDNLIK